MSWKDWSYWLRGGIIGVSISTVLFLLTILIIRTVNITDCVGDVCRSTFFGNVTYFIFMFLIWSAAYFKHLTVYNGLQILLYNFAAIISPIVQSFLIGTIIGWIYGKIKERR